MFIDSRTGQAATPAEIVQLIESIYEENKENIHLLAADLEEAWEKGLNDTITNFGSILDQFGLAKTQALIFDSSMIIEDRGRVSGEFLRHMHAITETALFIEVIQLRRKVTDLEFQLNHPDADLNLIEEEG